MRWLLALGLGTEAPVVGLVLVGVVALSDVPIAENTLAITIVVLGVIALVFGALVSALAAYATVHPIASIRRGLERVGEGDFSVEVPVWNSTEMGLLQGGFNEMAAGLRERERIRDLFGRQVGREAARQALAVENPQLGGEICDVAVLFVDVLRSTVLAASREPQEVVELLNRFFAEVVAAVDRHGAGSTSSRATLHWRSSGRRLRCRIATRRRWPAPAISTDTCERTPDLPAAIGVASGTVVAGHVGAESRFEYTVIGDPVNEAARLTELAKEHPSRVLASGITVATASEEGERWTLGEAVTLRGRSAVTRVAHPSPIVLD